MPVSLSICLKFPRRWSAGVAPFKAMRRAMGFTDEVRAAVLCLVLAMLTPGATGCARRAKADFRRPPATASTPQAPEPMPEPPADPPVVEEPLTVDDIEVEPAPEPSVDAEPAPPPPTQASPSPAPEPGPPAPAPHLADPQATNPEISSKLAQAGSLLNTIGARDLSSEQGSQVEAAKAFVAQAREAFAEGDERRALVLVDKGLLLAEDVERASRP